MKTSNSLSLSLVYTELAFPAVVRSDDLAVTTMGCSSSASVGEEGAGGSECPAVVDRLVIGDSRGRLGQGSTG